MMNNQYILCHTEGLTDPVDIALKRFEQHPSILKIRNVSVASFSFNTVPVEDVVLEILVRLVLIIIYLLKTSSKIGILVAMYYTPLLIRQ